MSKILSRTSSAKHKAKKSYTLSPESVAFLEGLRKKRHAASTSLVLDEIIQGALREQEKRAVEDAVSEYYGSLSDQERTERSVWGKFAETEFSGEER